MTTHDATDGRHTAEPRSRAELLDRAGDAFIDALGAIDAKDEPGLYGVVLADFARCRRSAGRLEEAAESLSEAADHLRDDPGTRDALVSALYDLSGVLQALGRTDGAVAVQLEVLETVRSYPKVSQRRLAEELVTTGDLLMEAGRPLDALELLYEGHELLSAEGVGARQEQSAVLVRCARAHRAAGQDEEALAALRKALAVVDPVEDAATCGLLLDEIAAVHRSAGRLQEAVEAGREAEGYLSEANGHLLAGALHHLGRTCELMGDAGAAGGYDDALAYYRRALALLRSEGDLGYCGVVLHDIGDVHQSQDRLEEAESAYEEAVELKKQDPQPRRDLVTTHRALGYVRQELAERREP
ncbi:tetratricopeptide repeat protein [Streptomyces sp. NPDC050738]|uniref:tetratricopeptide repeat protein n=1 Tax=Streptomyces sp. NPDC050738 TaxID=3154744 RepID=UPI003430844F